MTMKKNRNLANMPKPGNFLLSSETHGNNSCDCKFNLHFYFFSLASNPYCNEMVHPLSDCGKFVIQLRLRTFFINTLTNSDVLMTKDKYQN